ncbi:MAG: hypothetical protein HYV60_13230, partial [Planctomycetia bacterium]|nr:hypothetical protein [Planctomycetia bacterium]
MATENQAQRDHVWRRWRKNTRFRQLAALCQGLVVAILLQSFSCPLTLCAADDDATLSLEAKLEQKGTIILRDASLVEWLFAIQKEWGIDIVVGNELQREVVNGALLGILPVTRFDRHRFRLDACREALHEHFQVGTLDGFGCERLPLAIRAAGALIAYLGETQRSALQQLTALRTYSPVAYMILDPATRRNLELEQASRGGGA